MSRYTQLAALRAEAREKSETAMRGYDRIAEPVVRAFIAYLEVPGEQWSFVSKMDLQKYERTSFYTDARWFDLHGWLYIRFRVSFDQGGEWFVFILRVRQESNGWLVHFEEQGPKATIKDGNDESLREFYEKAYAQLREELSMTWLAGGVRIGFHTQQRARRVGGN